MHAGGPIGDHSTGSLVAVLREGKPATLWCTGASTPCIAAFKPVFSGSDSPPLFTDEAQSLQYWLQREHLHRAVITGLVDVDALCGRIKSLEAEWLAREQHLMSEDVPDIAALYTLSREAAAQEQALIDEFSIQDWQGGGIPSYWRKKNAVLQKAKA